MNYFWDVVLPQLIKYFEDNNIANDKELIWLLVADVLKTDPRYLDLIQDNKKRR